MAADPAPGDTGCAAHCPVAASMPDGCDRARGPARDLPMFRHCGVSEPASIRQMVEGVLHSARPHLSDEAIGRLELVAAEVLNNVAEHAYSGRPPGPIALTLWIDAGEVRCCVTDRGGAMPAGRVPTAALPDVAGKAIDDLPEGGWGWALIDVLARETCYCRLGNWNRLFFRVPLRPPVDDAF